MLDTRFWSASLWRKEARVGRPSKYPEEFRREAVALFRSSDRSRVEVARSLGISDGSLASWVKAAEESEQPGALDPTERAELARLRKENADLKMDREILRKSSRVFCPGDEQVSRRFVSEHAGEFPVKRLCALVGGAPLVVPRVGELGRCRTISSTTRTWRTRSSPSTRRRGARTGRRVSRASSATGAELALAQAGGADHGRVRPGRRPQPPEVAARTARHRASAGPVGVVTSAPSVPNQRWVADITEFATGDGKLYLAAVRDLFHRGIVGWDTSGRQDSILVVNALTMALARTGHPANVIHHADKGSIYTSLDFAFAAGNAAMNLSFGSTGDAYDNAAMETFWARLKVEIAWIRGSIWFETRAECHAYLFEFIEVFYNRQRHQSGLGHLTPAQTYAAQRAA
jgi:putative transposase